MGAENTDLVIKTFRTESDALSDTTPLYVNSSSDAQITNEAQSHSNFAGLGFYVYSEYWFRIEANEAVSEFYIDWDDGEDASLQKANYTHLKYDNPVFSVVTSHVFTQNKKHYPKIRVKSQGGLWSKLYTPSGANITGWEVLAQGESLSAGQNEIASVSYDATGANQRIPIFTPAEKAPVSILKADKKVVMSGINQLPLMGIDNDFDGEQVTVYCSNANRSDATIDIIYHDLTTDTIVKATKKHSEGINNVGKVLKVTLNNLNEATDSFNTGSPTVTSSLYPGERMYLEAGSDWSGTEHSHPIITEVSQGNPIQDCDDPDTIVTYDGTHSYAKSSNINVTDYWLDTGQWSKYYTPTSRTTWTGLQTEDSTFNHVSDYLSNGTNNILYSKSGIKGESYCFYMKNDWRDENKRFFPKGILARLQVGTDKSLSLDASGDTIQRSHLEHFRYDYYDKDAKGEPTTGKNRPADQRSSNLLAFKNKVDSPGLWTDLSSRNNSVTEYVLSGHRYLWDLDPNHVHGTDIATAGENYLIIARDKPWDSLFWDVDYGGYGGYVGSGFSRSYSSDDLEDFKDGTETGDGGEANTLHRAEWKTDVYYSAPYLGAGAIDGQDTKVWKPLRFTDRTKLFGDEDASGKHTSLFRSGSWEWDLPSDWEKVDPANIADRYYPTGSYDGRTYEESRIYLFAFRAGVTTKTISGITDGSYSEGAGYFTTSASHGLSVNDRVSISATEKMPFFDGGSGSASNIPGIAKNWETYFVKEVPDATHFTLTHQRGHGTALSCNHAGLGTVTVHKISGNQDALVASLNSKYTTLGNPVSHNIWFDIDGGGSNPSAAGDDIEVDVIKPDGGVMREAWFKCNFLDGWPKSVLQSDYIEINDVRTSTYATGTDYYLWFNVDSGGSDPSRTGRTGVEVAISSYWDGAMAVVNGTKVVEALRTAISAINGLSVSSMKHSFLKIDAADQEATPIGAAAMYAGATLTDNFNWATTSSGINSNGMYLSSSVADAYPTGGSLTTGHTTLTPLFLRYQSGMSLSGAINASVTTFGVSNASLYAASGDVIKVDNEYMLIGSRDTSANTVTVTRAYGGTSAASHDISSKAPYFENGAVSSGPKPVVVGSVLKIENEFVEVTTVNTGSIVVQRGMAGTTAATHADATLLTEVAKPMQLATPDTSIKNYFTFSWDQSFEPNGNDGEGIGNLSEGVAGAAAGWKFGEKIRGEDAYIDPLVLLLYISNAINADDAFTSTYLNDPSLKLTTLDEDLDSSETEVEVDKGSVFDIGDVVLTGSEQMKITNINGDALTVVRGYNSTTATAHSDNEEVYTIYVNIKAATKGVATDLGTTENLPADFYYDTLVQGADVTDSSFAYSSGVSGDFFHHDDRWNSTYKKYALLVLISTNQSDGPGGIAGSLSRHRKHIRHIWPFSNSHSQYIELRDPMHVSLNNLAVAQSISFVRKGKYHKAETREGTVNISKIGSSSGTIKLGGIDFENENTRDRVYNYQKKATPVYYDIEHNDGVTNGTTTRMFGIITNMSEDIPTGNMLPKFAATFQITKILTYSQSNGAITSKGFVSLGGEEEHVSDYY